MPRTATRTPARATRAAAKPARATATKSTTTRKPAAKPTPKPAPAKTRAAKAAPAKPTRATAKKSAPVAKAPVRRTRAAAPKPVAPPVAMGRDLDELTGFIVGTDSHIAAIQLQKGGKDRQDIIDTVRELLDPETRNGTVKPVANVVAATIKRLLERGWTIDSTFSMSPPAPRTTRGRRKA